MSHNERAPGPATRSDGDGVSGAPRGRCGAAGWLDCARAAGPSHRRAGRACVLRAPVAGVDWAAVLLRLPQPRQRRRLGHRGRRPAALQLGRDQRRRPGAGPRRLGAGIGSGGAGRGGELDGPGGGEVALAIADAVQGRGLGTILLGQLAEAADRAGIGVLGAEVLPRNHRMVTVFRDSGFPITTRTIPGGVLGGGSTALPPGGLEGFERREQTAAVAAMRVFLAPRSVAVVGASGRRGTVGAELFHNLLAGGFNGPVYPVNPNAPVVQSVVAYPSIAGVPGPVDLAVAAVPAAAVVGTAEECAAAGVRALVVLSAGFAETGPEGSQRQAQLLRVCREAGMRPIGPSSLGFATPNPKVGGDATLGPAMPLPGRVGFLSQSGAVGLAVVDYATKVGLGLSSFVSVGNKADISSNDLLDYWEQDPDTSVALLYLESFGNPRRFSRIARRVGRRKPIGAVK